MAEAFTGEIRAFAFSMVPSGWASCNGQTVSISQYEALYSILGVTYGGDGRTTFGLPNLNGRVAISEGQDPSDPNGQQYVRGQKGGTITHTISTAEMPAHIHLLTAPTAPIDTTGSLNIYSGNANTSTVPSGICLSAKGNTGAPSFVAAFAPNAVLKGAVVNIKRAGIPPSTNSTQNGSQPISLMQPYKVMNYCICLNGVYPSAN